MSTTADAPEVVLAEIAAEVNSVLDWDTVRRELEKIYRVQLTDDDPLRMVADVVRIVLLQSQAGAARVIKNQLAENLAEFNHSLDVSMKSRQQEGHCNIQNMLTVAQCQLKLAGSEVESQLRSETSELVSAAKDLRSVNRSMRWFDWFIGSVFMALILAVGIAVGMMWRSW